MPGTSQMSAHIRKVRAIWPSGLADDAAAAAQRPPRSGSHVTVNHGAAMPPEPEYGDVVAVGDALVSSIRKATDAAAVQA